MMNNLFADIRQSVPKELYTDLLKSKHLRIERIVSHGHASTPGKMYDQDQHVWVVILRGAAEIGFEDGTLKLRPGDFLNIPANQKHRIEWTTPEEPTVWLALLYGTQPTFVAPPTNVFANLAQKLPDEQFISLVETANVCIERIVSHGHASPEGFWYDQDRHEWAIVLKGAAKLRFEDQAIEMKPGDFISIPAHQMHRVEWTTPDEPTIWLAVFYG